MRNAEMQVELERRGEERRGGEVVRWCTLKLMPANHANPNFQAPDASAWL